MFHDLPSSESEEWDEERKDECVGVGRVGVGEGESVCEEGRQKG